MDDGIVPLPANFDIQAFINILNLLDEYLKFTVEISVPSHDMSYKSLNFLDIYLRLHSTGQIETDVYYKPTNDHDYLNYNSHHPKHVKENILFNLAKAIVVFCSNPVVDKRRLAEFRIWLLDCDYPESLINESSLKLDYKDRLLNLILQKLLYLLLRQISNYNAANIPLTSKNLLQRSCNERVSNVYRDIQPIISLRQPPNLLRCLSKAEFCSNDEPEELSEPGLFRCTSNSCLLCKQGYIQQCSSFVTSNGVDWQIRCRITCNSKNVIYFLKCTSCNVTTYTGKTNDFRKRMNGHKSSSTLVTSSDVFDDHYLNAGK